MVKCQVCQRELLDNLEFCEACGARQVVHTSPSRAERASSPAARSDDDRYPNLGLLAAGHRVVAWLALFSGLALAIAVPFADVFAGSPGLGLATTVAALIGGPVLFLGYMAAAESIALLVDIESGMRSAAKDLRELAGRSQRGNGT
jgi:hypothetical protein